MKNLLSRAIRSHYRLSVPKRCEKKVVPLSGQMARFRDARLLEVNKRSFSQLKTLSLLLSVVLIMFLFITIFTIKMTKQGEYKLLQYFI